MCAEKQGVFNDLPSIGISTDLWERIQDYLIPEDHPMKVNLDSIFFESRPLAGQKSMLKAGFTTVKLQKYSKILVTGHPLLPGYIVKAYLDKIDIPRGSTEYDHFIQRIIGARLVRESIHAHGYGHLMKVPEKWLYLLPDAPFSFNEDAKRMFILIEEDMNIFSEEKNRMLWKSKQLSKELLEALYVVTTELGLADSAKPDNCPFSKDGRIAFIDTAVFHRKMKYDKLTPHLSPVARNYWLKLIGKNA